MPAGAQNWEATPFYDMPAGLLSDYPMAAEGMGRE
jgi:hypothetical protein